MAACILLLVRLHARTPRGPVFAVAQVATHRLALGLAQYGVQSFALAESRDGGRRLSYFAGSYPYEGCPPRRSTWTPKPSTSRTIRQK
jgi:hypothetical protein